MGEDKSLQLIHMAKEIQYSGKKGKLIEEEAGKKCRKENSFFCYGYYDKVTRVYCTEDASFSYKDVFAIRYPYKKSAQPIYADQMFSLINQDIKGEDPFILNDEKPFMGIFLITVIPENGMGESFDQIVDKCIKNIKDNLEKTFDCTSGVYKTINCADICMVLRTDKVGDLYILKRDIEEYASLPDENINFKVILIVASDFPADRNKRQFLPEVVKKNKNEIIAIRFECQSNILDEINDLEAEGIRIVGTGGIGEYAMLIPFEKFSQCYDLYVKLKKNDVAELVSEGEDNIRSFFIRHKDDLLFLYERWLFNINQTKAFRKDDRNQCGEKYEAYIEQAMRLYNQLLTRIEEQDSLDCIERPDIMKHDYVEQKRLVKELLYTYNNFWYQKVSAFRGVFFYAQMEALLDGIEQQNRLLERVESESRRNLTHIFYNDLTEIFYNDLIEGMQRMIAGINSFSKLLLAANFNVRNIPNYEVQTKVNVEKYLYAYNMFLIKICKASYQNGNSKEKVFPIFYMDLSTRNIRAHTVFSSLESVSESEKRTRTFLIACPNYQRFANVYHVLPMITHEISHNFRYLERKERNEFFLRYLVDQYSVKIINALFEYPDQENYSLINVKEREFVGEYLKTILSEMVLEELKDVISDIHLRNALEYMVPVICNLCDIHSRREKSFYLLLDHLQNEMTEIFRLSNIEYVLPEDQDGTDDVELIIINCAIDLLMGDKEQVAKWKERIEELKGNEENEDVKKEYQKLTECLDAHCECAGAYRDCPAKIIDLAERALIYMQKQFFEHFLDIFEINEEDIKTEIEEDIKTEIIDKIIDERVKAICEKNKTNIVRIMVEMIGKRNQFGRFVKQLEGIPDYKKQHIFDSLCRLSEMFDESIDLIGKLRQLEPLEERNKSENFNFVEPLDFNVTYNKKDDKFIKKLHAKLKEEYRKKIQRFGDGSLNEDRWILWNSVQEDYTNSGILNPDSEQFCKMFSKRMMRLSLEDFQDDGQDYFDRYDEVCADLGMCEAFGFNYFGYFCYLIHLFMKERNMPMDKLLDLTEERIALVMKALYAEENGVTELSKKQLEELHQGLEKKISNYETILCERVESEKEQEQKMYRDMRLWMRWIFNAMNLKRPAISHIDLVRHFVCVRKAMKNKKIFKCCSENPIIAAIGKYYNEFEEQIGNLERKKECMENQNHFILQYHNECIQMCNEWKNAMFHVSGEMNRMPGIIEWMYARESDGQRIFC